MQYAIVGFGAVGQALAHMFARQGIAVAVASTHPPAAIASAASAIGADVTAVTLAQALDAETILLAVPFGAHGAVAAARSDWRGTTIVDVTNAYGVDLGDRAASATVAQAFAGAALVKAFNHLPARTLDQDPAVAGGRRVIFLAGDDDDATARVTALVERLGYAPVGLGRLAEGGRLVEARGTTWGPLIFKDLFRKDA